MIYRSTNTHFTHHQGALVAGVELGSGVELNPTSSGAAPTILPCGDESNKSLIIGGKGTGGVQLGQSSTTPIVAMQRYLVEFTPPALAASTWTSSTFTAAGLTTNAVLSFVWPTSVSGAYNIIPRCSTAAELRLTFQNITGSTIGTGESTTRGFLIASIF